MEPKDDTILFNFVTEARVLASGLPEREQGSLPRPPLPRRRNHHTHHLLRHEGEHVIMSLQGIPPVHCSGESSKVNASLSQN